MPRTMVFLSAITMMDTGMQLSKQMPLESTRGNLKARLCPLIWLANNQHLPNHMYSFCFIGKNIRGLRALLYITETVQEEHETPTSLGSKRSGSHICKGRQIHGPAVKAHTGIWSIFEIAVYDITDLEHFKIAVHDITDLEHFKIVVHDISDLEHFKIAVHDITDLEHLIAVHEITDLEHFYIAVHDITDLERFKIAVHDITDLLISARYHLLKALKLTQANARLVSNPLYIQRDIVNQLSR